MGFLNETIVDYQHLSGLSTLLAAAELVVLNVGHVPPHTILFGFGCMQIPISTWLQQEQEEERRLQQTAAARAAEAAAAAAVVAAEKAKRDFGGSIFGDDDEDDSVDPPAKRTAMSSAGELCHV